MQNQFSASLHRALLSLRLIILPLLFVLALPTASAATTLVVNGFASNYTSQSEPYKPAINLTGSGFNSVTQITWNCTMPNGSACSGSPYVWTPANWSGKYTVTNDSNATVNPTLLASGDPAGTYSWSVTFFAGSQQVSKFFTVTYSPTVNLIVNGFASNYTSSTEPYTPTINLTGSGFSSVTQITWNCTMPNGSTCSGSPYIWTPGNWSGKYTVTNDSNATVKPTLLASGDPAGTYSWSVTFFAGSQQVTKFFTVTYSPAVNLVVTGFASNYASSSEPYTPTINLTGSGFSSVTQITWNCTMPSGTACNGSPYTWTPANWSGKYTVTNDTNATVKPTLLASGDPAGTYSWSVTFFAGSQQVTKFFTVTYSPAVNLVVNGFANNYTSSTEPYTPTIDLTGSGFNSVTQISWSCTTPGGPACNGSPYVWTPGDWSGKYIVNSDSSATVKPTLLAAGDPAGTYSWSVTFFAGSQQATSLFTVTYSSSAPAAPVANPATNVTSSSFTANWGSSSGATGYRFDASASSSFSTFLRGYKNIDVGNTVNIDIGSLNSGTTYYYRVRAYNASGSSANSNTVSVTTTAQCMPHGQKFVVKQAGHRPISCQLLTAYYRPTPYPPAVAEGIHVLDGWLPSYYYKKRFQKTDQLIAGGWGDTYQSYLQYDLTGLPSTVVSATLELYESTPDDSALTDVILAQPTRSWTKTDLNRDLSTSMTWANQPSWQGLGTFPAGQRNNWWNIDITSLYRTWQYQNFGIMLAPVQTNNNFDKWSSSRSSSYDNRPILKLAYTPPAGVVIPVFKLPLPGGLSWVVRTEVGGYDCFGQFSGLHLVDGRPGYDPYHDTKNYFSVDFGWETAENYYSNPNGHDEINIPILAAASGTVVYAGHTTENGNFVVISHDDNELFTTRYIHLKSGLLVHTGDHVISGKTLGYMGNTGQPSTGVHLHFGIRYGGGTPPNVGDGYPSSNVQYALVDGWLMKSLQSECSFDSSGTPIGYIRYYKSTNTAVR